MQHDDDSIRLRETSGRTFGEVLEEVNLKRRGVLKAGLGTAALGFFGVPALLKSGNAAAAPTPGFTSVPFVTPIPPLTPVNLRPGSLADTVRVPSGYSVRVLIAHGDPIRPGFAPWSGAATESAEHQANAFGAHSDGMHFFPFPQRGAPGGLSSTRGILCNNNEYVDQGMLFPDGFTSTNGTPEKLAKALAAHGVSIVETQRGAGGWAPVVTSPFNRRVSGATPCTISGPAAGHPLMQTPLDPTGRTVLGTLNNCAHGYTPWGTYLTCEENFNGYFGSSTTFTPNGLEAAIGLSASGFGYNWHTVSPEGDRFDLNKNKVDASSTDPARNRNNEPNRFGWVVEIDPFNPSKPPVKRTALGRCKHENAAYSIAPDGRLVIYTGDDQVFEYIYKWVSRDPVNPTNRTANENLLDNGTLYVARFDAGTTTGDNAGTGVWLELSMNVPALATQFNNDLGAMLVDTRRAADTVGATPMDRPEWITVAPNKDVYCTLTNNSGRSTTPGALTSTATPPVRPRSAVVDESNPRGPNPMGHIIRWTETGGDPAALTFTWDIFVLAGDPLLAAANAQGNINGDKFAAPDGIWFDYRGLLWIQTDISSGSLGSGNFTNMPNNMMLACDPQTKEVRRFLTGPYGCEITGVITTPDSKTMFVGIQHPGEGAGDITDPAQVNRFSTWPGVSNASGGLPVTPPYGAIGRPRSGVVVITKNDGGVIGS
jgi:hypothetical protein